MPDPAHLRGAQDAAKRDQHAQAFELLEGQIMYVMKLDAADARALLAERLPVQEPVGG